MSKAQGNNKKKKNVTNEREYQSPQQGQGYSD